MDWCRFSVFKSVFFQVGSVFGIGISKYRNIGSVFREIQQLFRSVNRTSNYLQAVLWFCYDNVVETIGLPVGIFSGGSVLAEWLACWTQSQKGLGSNRSRDAIG